MIERARGYLRELGLPDRESRDVPDSPKRFPDGAQYRVEIPSTEGPAAMAAVVEQAAADGVTIHRVSQGSGILLLRDDEIAEMVRLGAEHGIEVCLFVGPRAPWEGSAASLVPDGKIFGWRHMTMDQLAYAYADVERAVDLGLRSVLVADEGLAWMVGEARRRGRLPGDLVVKASALMGLSNPVQIRLLVELGIDSVNVSSDISIGGLATLRAVIDTPVDLYVEGPDGLGGFIRHAEVPEIVRVAAPVYLKFGLRNAPGIYPSGRHLEGVAIATARERVRRAALGLDVLRREMPDAVGSAPGAAGLGVPRPRS